MATPGKLTKEGATILPGRWKNFSGNPTDFTPEGVRTFHILLEPELAAAMAEDGWNVKQTKERPDGSPGDYHLQVNIKYWDRFGNKLRPPKVVLIGSKGRVDLSEAEIEILDYVDMANVDLIIRPSRYDINGRQGIKAYLEAIYVTVEESYLDQKYSDVPYADGGSSDRMIAGGQRLALESSAGPGASFDENGNEILEAELVED